MSFKDMVAADNCSVFLNDSEMADRQTIEYDGDVFADIPVVLSGLKEKDRRQLMSDHVQGLYLVHTVLHCALSDLGGKQPEKGTRLSICDNDESCSCGAGFRREYYVASSVCEMGMLRVELEAIDE